jgi:predicted DNA-binding transcriptional regulator AlpA
MPTLPVEQAAQYCGVSVSFLNRARFTGDGPIFLKIGRRVAYRRDDLDIWLTSCRRSSTSQTVAA